MIKLFSEKVDATLTNSDHNILQVKSFEEAFFDVYEFELNGQKYIGESIGTYNTDPIINVPVVENGNEYEVPFVLRQGPQLITYNNNKGKTLLEKTSDTELSTNVNEEKQDELSLLIEDKLAGITDTTQLPSKTEHNILQVEDLQEAFFDVFEFKLNGQQFIKESIGNYGDDPIINISIVKDGEDCEMPFVLRQGLQDIALTNKNAIVVEKVLDQSKVREVECEIVEQLREIPAPLSKEELFEIFQEEKEVAINALREQNAATMEEVERIRDSILIDAHSEAFEARTKEQAKLTEFVESKLKEITKTNQILASKIEKDVDLSLESTYGDFVKKLKAARNDLNDRELENKKLVGEINVLEKAHIELSDSVNKREVSITESHDKLDRSVNKALSRLGQTNKELANSKEQFEDVQQDLQERINKAEERVKQYYNDHIKTVEDSVFTNIRKNEIINVVKNSKAQIIAELDNARGLKQQVTSFIKEATEDYDPVAGNKNFLKSIEKRISKKFEEEMSRIKRMIEFGGGGGSGQQLNNGGTINGNLNINGNILSGGLNLDLLFARAGSIGTGTIAGSGTAGRVTLWDGISSITDSKLVQTATGIVLSGALSAQGNISGQAIIGTSLSATAVNSGILSAGRDLNEIFQIQGADSTAVLSNGIGVQTLTYNTLSAASVAVSQSILSGGASHVQGTFTLSGAGGAGYNTTIDLGLQTGDNPSFAGVTGGNVRVGVTGDNEIDTSSGNLTIDSAGGTTTLDDTTIAIPNVGAGTDNTVLVKSGNNLATDEIDGKVWNGVLIDGYGTQDYITKYENGSGTISNSIMLEKDAGSGFPYTSINVLGGLSAVSLSGNGIGLTGVIATPIFPTTVETTLAGSDKFFINDGANKHITYTSVLTSLDGIGICVHNGNSLAIQNAGALNTNKILKWNGSGFDNSIMTETSLGNISIAGGATITGNLSVQGNMTCIDTTVSVTSALSVVNAGTGPAIFARQTGTDQPIARFIDTEGGYITFDDGGNVGIGIDSPTEKLDVVGNVKASGSLTIGGAVQLGNAAADSTTIDSEVITVPNIAAGTGSSVIVRNGSNRLVHDAVDSKIFGTALVDGEGSSNKIPKYTNGTGTIGDSNITDTGSLVSIDSDLKLDPSRCLIIAAPAVTGDTAFNACTRRGTFSSVVTSVSSHPIPTFCKNNLKQAKYNVTLIKGVNITAFEVQAVFNNSNTVGTVYGVVDGQTATQLNTAGICNGSSTIDLFIKSVSGGTCAIVTGEALYLS